MPIHGTQDFFVSVVLLILETLHDSSVLHYHNCQGIRYLGRCRICSIHHKPDINTSM